MIISYLWPTLEDPNPPDLFHFRRLVHLPLHLLYTFFFLFLLIFFIKLCRLVAPLFMERRRSKLTTHSTQFFFSSLFDCASDSEVFFSLAFLWFYNLQLVSSGKRKRASRLGGVYPGVRNPRISAPCSSSNCSPSGVKGACAHALSHPWAWAPLNCRHPVLPSGLWTLFFNFFVWIYNFLVLVFF